MTQQYPMYQTSGPDDNHSWQLVVKKKLQSRLKTVSVIDSLCMIILTVVSGYAQWCWLPLCNICWYCLYQKYPILALKSNLVYHTLLFVAKSLFAFSHYRLYYIWFLYLGGLITSSLAIFTSIQLIKTFDELKNYSLHTVRSEISL